MTTTRQFRWFWAWDDEKEEAWLREMSQKGQRFKSVSAPGFYLFEQGEPIDYVYRLDYFVNRKDKTNYLELFRDAGWDYCGEMNGWQYFRREAGKGELQEIFTDNVSKARKYQRLMLYFIIFLPIVFHLMSTLHRSTNSIMQGITFMMAVILLLYVYMMARLLHRITQLLKKTRGRI